MPTILPGGEVGQIETVGDTLAAAIMTISERSVNGVTARN
jgi:hypothetical protein